jgi:uncharacterized protein (UPF0332 family)
MMSQQLALLKKASESLQAAQLLAEQEFYSFALQAETHINRAKEFLELAEQPIGPTPSSETDKP